MMRSGRILAEGSPDNLLKRYHKESLEDVFLTLCMQDDKSGSGKVASLNTPSTPNMSVHLDA